jgi:peptidoglycan-binding protein CsiV
MKKRVSLLLLPLLAAGALAQETLENEEQLDVRSYTVEMIIFSYAQSVSTGSEIFPPDLPPDVEVVDDLLFDDLGDEATLESIPEIVEEPEVSEELEDKKYELEMLAEEDFGLLEAYEHLERLDAYEPLMHFGWTQPTYPDEEVEARPLSSFATPPDGLEGELTLYLSRYLHLAVKLQLDESFADEPVEGDVYYEDFNEDSPVSYPVRFRIDEDRIFRNGELRYFDHPKFGVLAKITRVEEEEPELDDLIDNMEMLGD